MFRPVNSHPSALRNATEHPRRVRRDRGRALMHGRPVGGGTRESEHRRSFGPLSTATVAMISASVLLLGCDDPLRRFDDPFRADLSRLRSIDELPLSRISTATPQSVDDAVEALRREILGEGPSADSMSLELAEVRAAALEGNLELQVEFYAPSIAAAQVREEEAKFEWTFFAETTRARVDRPSATVLEGTQIDTWRSNAGIRVPLRTGGTVVVDLPFSDVDTNNEFSALNPAYEADFRFSISQPLLRNAGIRPSTFSIRVAQRQAEIVDARTRLAAIRILANADRAYWATYAAARELEVRHQALELTREQLAQAERLVEAGTAPEIEVVRARSGVAQSIEGIIVADTALRIQQRELKRIMGRSDLPIAGSTLLVPVTEPSPTWLELDPSELALRAVANRMELLELEIQLAIDASTIDFQRNQALPLFVLDYQYGVHGLGSSYRRAFRQVGKVEFDDWTLGLRMEVPLGNEAAKARVQQAILQRVQRLATRDQRREAIRQETLDALDRLRRDWQRIVAARQETILAGRTLEGERRQFDLGVRTSTDVLDAAFRLADAQSREVAALADYQISQVDIAFATGTLLGAGRVEWAPATAPPAAPERPAPVSTIE